jgi:hypothetical protein
VAWARLGHDGGFSVNREKPLVIWEGLSCSMAVVNYRVVSPEILDHLAWDDPEAVRARRDLRFINWVMGNERWICRAVTSRPGIAARGIVELGAGDGTLAAKLARLLPEAAVTAWDLAPRPAGLEARVAWRQEDISMAETVGSGGILVANLFLHHFEADVLRALGARCGAFDMLVLCEPDRCRRAEWLSLGLWPWIGRVTRHDMPVSIRAGFAVGELPALLGMGAEDWQVREWSTWRGARRIVACRTS